MQLSHCEKTIKEKNIISFYNALKLIPAEVTGKEKIEKVPE